MRSSENVFFEMPCLTEKSKLIQGEALAKKLKVKDKRYLSDSLLKFVVYNKDLLEFLKATPKIEGSGKDAFMSFKSENFIGAIPLRSPITGKQIGDFVVRPRYTSTNDQFSEYVEIVNLLESEILPEFKHSIPLLSHRNIRPPLYLEAIKFIKLFETAVKTNWNKFQNIEKIHPYPNSEVNWKSYVEKEFDPAKRLLFPCRNNTLSKFHRKIFELKYVYNIAKKEIYSFKTPKQIKYQFQDTLTYLDNALYEFPEKFTKELQIHNSDPIIIKKLTTQGNKILIGNFEEITAWRIDLSLLFERYVQFIFKQISLEIGAKQLNNYKIRQFSRFNPPWALNYLEPDLILVKNSLDIIVDAKYKSHLFNLKSSTEGLKEEHRRDLHQLLAYTAFSKNKNKVGILCYPSNKQILLELDYVFPHSNVESKVVLLGIPLKKSELFELRQLIINFISKLEKERSVQVM